MWILATIAGLASVPIGIHGMRRFEDYHARHEEEVLLRRCMEHRASPGTVAFAGVVVPSRDGTRDPSLHGLELAITQEPGAFEPLRKLNVPANVIFVGGMQSPSTKSFLVTATTQVELSAFQRAGEACLAINFWSFPHQLPLTNGQATLLKLFFSKDAAVSFDEGTIDVQGRTGQLSGRVQYPDKTVNLVFRFTITDSGEVQLSSNGGLFKLGTGYYMDCLATPTPQSQPSGQSDDFHSKLLYK